MAPFPHIRPQRYLIIRSRLLKAAAGDEALYRQRLMLQVLLAKETTGFFSYLAVNLFETSSASTYTNLKFVFLGHILR